MHCVKQQHCIQGLPCFVFGDYQQEANLQKDSHNLLLIRSSHTTTTLSRWTFYTHSIIQLCQLKKVIGQIVCYANFPQDNHCLPQSQLEFAYFGHISRLTYRQIDCFGSISLTLPKFIRLCIRSCGSTMPIPILLMAFDEDILFCNLYSFVLKKIIVFYEIIQNSPVLHYFFLFSFLYCLLW